MNEAPVFNADSAFAFIAKQVSFGPRVPETESHAACGDHLANRLRSFGARVVEQTGSVTLYNGKRMALRNIQAAFSPEKTDRIVLCAHWDTRPIADQEATDFDRPIDGANDGASGVGVLLEIARCLSERSPNVGVDIVLFDVEDQGVSAKEPANSYPDHGFCLGSRYWAENLPDHRPRYGILLDMVGAKDAEFTLEGVSMQYAEHVMLKVWDTAYQMGHGDRFRYNRTPPIIDDHTYINALAEIPTIDIIQFYNNSFTSFGPFWHNHSDTLGNIDRNTLKVVGQTVVQVIYNE